jgi:hypothetical protein
MDICNIQIDHPFGKRSKEGGPLEMLLGEYIIKSDLARYFKKVALCSSHAESGEPGLP